MIRIVLDRKLGGPIPNSIAFLALEALLRRPHVPPRRRRLRPPGRRSEGRRHRAARATRSSGRCRARTATRSATSRWPRRRSRPRAPPARSSSSSRAATGAQLPPDYGLLGHAADKASLATIKRIDALATTACGDPQRLPAVEEGLDRHGAARRPAVDAPPPPAAARARARRRRRRDRRGTCARRRARPRRGRRDRLRQRARDGRILARSTRSPPGVPRGRSSTARMPRSRSRRRRRAALSHSGATAAAPGA